ncbi:DMT family transporter [Paenibacillus illinoisensis]|uniref:DMT family transporter n=1 Tax=Paenibacillus illinoisensis TaxID=59845 RepID=UPI000FD91A6E|nr:DMT family transporter [Paenibacillus illinoisensis]
MVTGILLALLAGSLVSLQTVFNSKVNEKTGSWSTTTMVLFTGFLASFLISILVEGKNTFSFQHMQPWYWVSGAIGVGVVFCLVQGMKLLGPTFAISIVLTSQLSFALLFDSMGWLGLEKIPFSWNQLLGVLVIVGGIVLFKFGGSKNNTAEKPRRALRSDS